jgi:hypothetical protein
MKISQLVNGQKTDFFDYHRDEVLEKEVRDWKWKSSIRVNGILSVGWFLNNDILVIGADGVFIANCDSGELFYEDYETDFNRNFSPNNLFYTVKERNEKLNVFGLRGGGGNLISPDKKWKIDIVCVTWRFNLIQLSNLRENGSCYIELSDGGYEDKLHCGFSEDGNYFLVKSNNSIDVFARQSKK